MRYFLFSLSLLLFIACCKEDLGPPCDHIPSYPIEDLALNEIDENRLCLAETLSKLFKDESFRVYIQEQSIKDGKNWNREYVLVTHFNQESYDGKTLAKHVEKVIEANAGLCIQSIEDFEERLFSDPLLVLKLPDLIPAEEWDVERTVPFLYVQTRDLVNADPEGGLLSMLGLHPSGVMNRYFNGMPDYFPFVLKQSEDFILINESLMLSTGTRFNTIHSDIPNEVYGSSFISDLPKINNSDWGIIAVNDLLKYINQFGIEERDPYPFDENCNEDCDYDCIPEEERKLIATHTSIDNQNPDAIEYEFESVYRPYGQTILFDNILPLVFTKHVTADNSNSWRRILLGSFRVNDFYDVSFENQVNYHKCQVDGEGFQLPELILNYEVAGKKLISLDNILLHKLAENGDILSLGFASVTLDVAPVVQVANFDQNPIAVSYIIERGLQNYDAYCFNNYRLIGSNSVALHPAY